jgi:hypothetical protein
MPRWSRLREIPWETPAQHQLQRLSKQSLELRKHDLQELRLAALRRALSVLLSQVIQLFDFGLVRPVGSRPSGSNVNFCPPMEA